MGETERRRDDGALLSATAGLSSAATSDEILRAILADGGRTLASSAAVAYVLSDDRRRLRLAAHHGISDAIAGALEGMPIESGFPVARCLREGQPIWIDSPDTLARDFPDFERTVGGAVERQALVALPLRVRGDVVAGLGFAFPDARTFDDSERTFLRALAERCESALERALLYEESQRERAAAERSRAEMEALLRFNEIVSGILAHDLRNPLAAVLMNARLLRNAERERERTVGARIVSSGERMTRMIDQILDWTRVRSDAGHVQLIRNDCDLATIAEQVIGEHRTRAGDTAIALEALGSLRGLWDGDRLAQVLSNLVGNALEHASQPGVRVRLDGGEADVVTIEVHSRGHIDDQVLPVIFEPFRGRASGLRLRGSGLGLGLYITKQIVGAHGGRIEVSQPPDDWVVFSVTLPRSPSV